MGRAAGVEPCARSNVLGSPRAGPAMLGLDVASQRIFENRKEEFELAAGRMPSGYGVVILNRQKRVAVSAVSVFASSVLRRRIARIVLIPHFLLAQKKSRGSPRSAVFRDKPWVSAA